MKWTISALRKLKNITLAIGTVIILLYLILSWSESITKIIPLIILIPVLVWPFLAWHDARQAYIMALTIGIITIIWFIIDFFVLRIHQEYWHIPVFILIAPLPAFILAYMMWVYHKHELKGSRKKRKRFGIIQDPEKLNEM
jgi:hypothetical protein